ncbi:recombinase family protein [Peribacillus kribbensis]|uniref:recombinase family protein n=1 Tax=Peribacillus kribbensis TaxID=356658 RepID=UPI0004034BE3|nr:recombinase family protein [Peribacillus kribbensis]
MTKYGYARVSTRKQEIGGNSLESQIEKLQSEGCQVIFEEAFTGTKIDRPEFKRLLDQLKEGDTLVVTKLDRFARSTVEGINVVKQLFERGIKVHILNMGLVENSPTGKLVFTIMSAFAEFERDMIVERTQEGKAVARQRDDFKDGRPKKFTKKQIAHALQLLQDHSYKQVEELTGISKSTLIRAKKHQEEQNAG